MAKSKGLPDPSLIPAHAVLTELGIKYESTADDEIRVVCPYHADSHPSCYVNTKKGVFKCQAAGCEATGTIFHLLAKYLECDVRAVIQKLEKDGYDISVVKAINPQRIEEWHEKVWKAGPLLAELRKRGITDDDIRAARLGFHDGRIMIPVPDDQGRYLNVRKYLPGAPSHLKMKNQSGYKAFDLYQPRPKQFSYDSIWVCGGEIKALAASGLLNKHGVGCVAVTGGEGNWEAKFNPRFKDKRVYVCMDVDPGGRAAARKVARKLLLDASSVFLVTLPLDRERYPKGDLNDYIGAEEATDQDLLDLMVNSPQVFEQDVDIVDNVSEDDIKEVSLKGSTDAELFGHGLQFDATVNAMDTTPYIVPKVVGVTCGKDQNGCDHCPVRPKEPDEVTGEVVITIKGTSPGLLSTVSTSKKFLREATREAARIPPCKTAEFSVKEHFNVFDVRLTPPLDIGGENSDHVVQSAFVVDADLELNSPYIFKGRVFPHPRSQQAVLLVDDVKRSEDNLTAYKPDDESLEKLRIFQVETTLDEKLAEIYGDLETNVTEIFQRRELHLALDLAFHSVLNFSFDGKRQNGWLNLLVAGDSSQGKSEASQQLMHHYGVGQKYECKNASAAGLIGGATQMAGGNRWFIQWGVIPTFDRMLVVMEEIKGMPIEVLGKLTDMRSSGVAEITMIERRKAHARTRLIMISNPRSQRPVAAYNFGVEVIKELVGSLEDVRRFDLCVLLSAQDVDPAVINQLKLNRETRVHKYKSKLCRELVLWAWSRQESQVRFTVEAERACLTHAMALCEKFTESLPLCDRGTTRFKVARMAAALAARVFSTDGDDLQTVLVTIDHVNYIANFIDTMYSSNSFGYLDFSKAQVFANEVIDPNLVKKQLQATKYPKELVEHLLHADEITVTDLSDWCEIEKSDAQSLLSFLVRKHAIYRVKRWYVKTGQCIQILKQMQVEGIKQAPMKGQKF